MKRFILMVISSFSLVGAASAQVTCARTGDQVFCNGSLHPPTPPQPRVYYDPYGSRQSGYEAGVREGRARNLAGATRMYLNGDITPEDRERFLQYIAKNGGDVAWFRNDMILKDQEQGIATRANAARPETPSVIKRLKELDALLKSGAVTQSEYDAKRKEILDSI